MKRSPKTLSIWLVAFFLCAQLFSLCGAFDTMDDYLDDIDPEEIVSVDPFVSSNQTSVALLPSMEMFVSAVLTWNYLFELQLSTPVLQALEHEFCVVTPNKLWLLNRSLLI